MGVVAITSVVKSNWQVIIVKIASGTDPAIPLNGAELSGLEAENGVQYVAARRESDQMTLGALGEGEVLDAIRRCQPDTLTPIEAMSLIYEWKQKLQ